MDWKGKTIYFAGHLLRTVIMTDTIEFRRIFLKELLEHEVLFGKETIESFKEKKDKNIESEKDYTMEMI